MTYTEVLSWMFSQLPMYQREGGKAYKASLDNSINLAAYLGNPHSKFNSVHVGGTNGKGSTSHMIASVLQEAGFKVGLYTSPHLKDFRERIRINGTPISKGYVVDFINKHQPFFKTNNVSFFELTVAMAFNYFTDSNVDIAVIEVGLGGRLDSTNIINPKLAVITNIGLDHTQFLGDTLEKIAVEKAGIIKPNVPIVIGQTQPEVQHVFIEKAKATQSKIIFSDTSANQWYPTDLLGNYQKMNQRTVISAVSELKSLGYQVLETHIKKGLAKVVRNTGLQGRWQIIGSSPKIVCDTAHNTEGLSLVIEQLLSESYANLHIVFGSVNDKDLTQTIKLLPDHAYYYLCKPDIPRGLDVLKLGAYFKINNKTYSSYNSVEEAFNKAKQTAKASDLIFVGGSTFVVAEII